MRQSQERPLTHPAKLATPADRTAAGDDRQHYDSVEIALHWTTAVLVGGLWLIAQGWSFLPRGGDGRHALQSLHTSFGVLFALVLLARILWRIGPGRRPAPAGSGLMELGARLVHGALYLLLIAQVVSGPLWRWAGTAPLSPFGLFTIPSPFALTRDDGRIFGDIHAYVGNTIIVLAGLHALAALFHHFVLRDGVLRRMLPATSGRR